MNENVPANAPTAKPKHTFHHLIDAWMRHEPDSPLGRAFLAGALANLHDRVRALELCPENGRPHRWTNLRADGTPQSAEEPTVCKHCGIEQGGAP